MGAEPIRNRRKFLKAGAFTAAGTTLLSPLEVSSCATQTEALGPLEFEEVSLSELQTGLASGKYTSRQLAEPYSMLQVMLFEFKDDLNRYLKWLGNNSHVRTLKDVIAFNDNHREQELQPLDRIC